METARRWTSLARIYLARFLLLASLAIASLVVAAPTVAAFIFGVVIPYNFLAQPAHLRRGEAHRLLPLDQPLAAVCALFAPQVLVGCVVCMVASATDAMGVPVRRVQGCAATGSLVLVLAAMVHGDATMAAYVIPQLGCALATSNVVSYLKNKQSAASQRFENLLDGIPA